MPNLWILGGLLIFVAKACQSFLDEMCDWNLFESFFKWKMWRPKPFQFKIPSFFFPLKIVTIINFVALVVLQTVMTCANKIQIRPGFTANVTHHKYKQVSVPNITEMVRYHRKLEFPLETQYLPVFKSMDSRTSLHGFNSALPYISYRSLGQICTCSCISFPVYKVG